MTLSVSYYLYLHERSKPKTREESSRRKKNDLKLYAGNNIPSHCIEEEVGVGVLAIIDFMEELVVYAAAAKNVEGSRI